MDSSNSARGNFWRHAQILDLLDVWGEEKIQQQLRAAHRNIDSFELIALEMRKRGHNGTAKECRTKTKCMRQEYWQVVNHNEKSGNNTATCAYYHELHSILCGDATVRPKRIVSSLQITRTPTHGHILPEERSVQPDISTAQRMSVDSDNANPEELFSDVTDIGDVDFNPQTPQILDEEEVTDSQVDEEASTSSCTDVTTPEMQENDHDTGIPNHVARLSPATRLAMLRNRRTRRTANDVAQRLMQHCARENDKTRILLQQEASDFSKYLENAQRTADRLQEESRTDRRELISSIQLHASILQQLVDKLPDAKRNLRERGINYAEINELASASENLLVTEDEHVEMLHSSQSSSSTPKKAEGLVCRPRRIHKPNIPFSP